MTDKNYSVFKDLISNHDWSAITCADSCANGFSDFYAIMKNFFNKAFPICKIKKAYRNRLPWLNDPLKKMIKLKNKLYVKQSRHDTLHNKTQYLRFKRSLRNAIYSAEKSYYNDLIKSYKGNSKKTWDVIKTVINKKKSACTFPEFFIDGCLVSALAISIPASHFVGTSAGILVWIPLWNCIRSSMSGPPVTIRRSHICFPFSVVSSPILLVYLRNIQIYLLKLIMFLFVLAVFVQLPVLVAAAMVFCADAMASRSPVTRARHISSVGASPGFLTAVTSWLF